MEDSSVKIENGKINFYCKMNYCSNSCCGPFKGINNQIGNVDNRPFEEIVLTEVDRKRIYENGFADLIDAGYSIQMQKEYYRMYLESDGTCRAYKNGKCSINSIKPTLCKAFPFYFDMFSGLCAIICEGFSDEYWADLSDYQECFDAARKMYEFWIDFYTKKNEQ